MKKQWVGALMHLKEFLKRIISQKIQNPLSVGLLKIYMKIQKNLTISGITYPNKKI